MMKILITLFTIIAVCAAFDCFGRNATCVDSHAKCDNKYVPFCEHIMPGPGRFIGVCSCDKACNSPADCTNPLEEGCPTKLGVHCDMFSHVCHCGERP